MKHVDEHTATFRDTVKRTLVEMFGVATEQATEVRETNSVVTEKTFIVSIHYTGTVFGEYLLAMDEETAARAIGISDPIDDDNREEIRDDICDAISEALNTVVGEAIVELQQTYAKLTLAAPRVFFGKLRYPRFRTGSASLLTEVGEVECHFCLDLMRLNLAESYSEAMSSLMDVNRKLKDANAHLAEQQAQLVHSEKMASIGMLAAGVAHEINSPLFVVEANLATLDEYVSVMETTVSLYEKLVGSLGESAQKLPQEVVDNEDDDLDFILEDTKTLLGEARDSATRIKTIVRKLKDFSHVDRGGVVATDLNTLTGNVIAMLGQQLSGCQLNTKLGEIPEVNCNPGEIGQVLINLLLNAIQAYPQGDGQIELSTRLDNEQVVVTVADSGCGISSEDLERIFDPFFTTRDVGEGTGLGLSISYGIVRKHEGSLTIESQQGSGTTAMIRLPCEVRSACC